MAAYGFCGGACNADSKPQLAPHVNAYGEVLNIDFRYKFDLEFLIRNKKMRVQYKLDHLGKVECFSILEDGVNVDEGFLVAESEKEFEDTTDTI